MIIRGNIVGITTPAADFNQEDPAGGDYIRGRERIANHMADTANPHAVTAQQTGAAAESHTHSPAEAGSLSEEAIRTLIRQELGVIEHGTY